MTMRDWFAGQVLPTLLGKWKLGDSTENVARSTYIMADAMMKAREEPTPPTKEKNERGN
jgi:hypothetical protein